MSRRTRKVGRCALCENERPLSEDHVPPRGAFNDRQVLLAKIEEIEAHSATLRWRTHTSSQRGLVYCNLCDQCNQLLGQRYNRACVEFAHRVASSSGLQRVCRVGGEWCAYPLRILKTAVQCFVSSLGASFVASNPWCHRFLLNHLNQELPDVVHLYLYAMTAEGTGRSTAPIAMGEYRGRNLAPRRIVAEFASWPIGIVLSYSNLVGFRLTPIDHFRDYSWCDGSPVPITLHVLASATPFPLDFGSMDEVVREAGGNFPPW